jgi:hypothetical protein
MSFKRFNRYELFDGQLMKFHSTTIRLVEDFFMDRNESWFNELTNMLCGIWDGYLYEDLLPKAKESGLPIEDVRRIETVIDLIEEYLEANSNIVTAE